MNQNSPSKSWTEKSVTLSEEEQDRLIRAIESAIEVSRQDQFHIWLRGPFRALLPHEIVVCVELRVGGNARQIDCLYHNLLDAGTIDLLCNPEHGLVLRLAKTYRIDRRQSCTVGEDALNALLNADSTPPEPGRLHNVVIHRITLLSGASYFFVLVNVPRDLVGRSRQLFKLVSSHLKMALARTIAGHDRRDGASLTRRELEILQWMSKGKSNREISVILGISAITLKNHVSKLYRKLNVQNRAEAVSRGLSSPVS